jgi:hypothetical protein
VDTRHLFDRGPSPSERGMGLWLVGRRPVLSKVGYSNSPDLNADVMKSYALHLAS